MELLVRGVIAIEFTNKNWGTWCTHHIEYMTELQNILKEGKK